RYGQPDLYGRAAPQLAFNGDVAAGLRDESIDLAQTQAGAVSDLLGGEKRVERPRDGFLIHSRAGVGDGYQDVTAIRRSIGAGDDGPAIRIGCFNRERATIEHGVARVDGKVEQGIIQLVRIDEHAA